MFRPETQPVASPFRVVSVRLRYRALGLGTSLNASGPAETRTGWPGTPRELAVVITLGLAQPACLRAANSPTCCRIIILFLGWRTLHIGKSDKTTRTRGQG